MIGRRHHPQARKLSSRGKFRQQFRIQIRGGRCDAMAGRFKIQHIASNDFDSGFQPGIVNRLPSGIGFDRINFNPNTTATVPFGGSNQNASIATPKIRQHV